MQYFGLVSSEVAMKSCLIILFITSLIFLLILSITRHVNKSLQLCTLLGVILLFYGNIKELFQFTLHAEFISRYSVLLPFVFIIAIILIVVIIKKRDYRQSNLFQNVLLIIFILIDSVVLIFSNKDRVLVENLLAKNEKVILDSLSKISSKPDVYYLVFDSYPGSGFLKQYMGYDNGSFDSTLSDKGFYVVKNPKSNYNRTVFSISSTLNFQYLDNINKFSAVNPKLYNQALLTVKHSIVPKFFKHLNYNFYNLSIFSINDMQPIHKESFLTISEKKVLLNNTLTERFKKDLLWTLLTGKYTVGFLQKWFNKTEVEIRNEQLQKRDYNNAVIDSVFKIPSQKENLPKFIYAHLYLPHPPFFYDENGKENEIQHIINNDSSRKKQLFIQYLKYTNMVIMQIINRIKNAPNKNVVIIIQGDHGFTDYEGGPNEPHLFFKNYSAIYFPDKNYSTLYDTISNVNTFPIIFNKYFNTKIPLQRDTAYFLRY